MRSLPGELDLSSRLFARRRSQKAQLVGDVAAVLFLRGIGFDLVLPPLSVAKGLEVDRHLREPIDWLLLPYTSVE